MSKRQTPFDYAKSLQMETGATGLEPATSGVTDRYELNRSSRFPPDLPLEQAFRTAPNRL